MNHLPPSEDMRRLLSSAHAILDQVCSILLIQLPLSLSPQPAPPTVREILAAYSAKGDGDRDMLLAMFNAKTAEDQVRFFLSFVAHIFIALQRVASLVNLHRTMLEVYQHAPPPPERPQLNGAYHYPTQSHHPSSRRTVHHRHRVTSPSRSPPPTRVHLQSSRDPHHPSEHPRKRHRSSRSPHLPLYESSHPEQFPPSPYSSSDRSNSAEYSPRSRASMTIGSLLSAGPSREMNGDIHERD